MSVSWANIAAWLQDCTAKENGAQKMGRIFYIMGKSATGKDTVFKELLKRRPELTTVVPYTTRCLLYTSDAADELDGVDLGGRRIIKKKFFQAEDGIRDQPRSRGLGDVYKRQSLPCPLYIRNALMASL